MSSIALFPCVLTGGAGVVGELATKLDARPYTDEDLIHETVRKYGGEEGKFRKLLYGKVSVFNKFTLEKERAVSLFKLVLADKLQEAECHLFYGLHTVLIPSEVKEVLRTLVVDNKQIRINKGISEGLTKREAKDKVRTHDVSAFSLTDFLFKKEAYDSELFDLVIPAQSRDHLAISKEIIKYYHTVSVLRTKESQIGVSNMKRAAKVELELISKGHKLPVQVHGNVATLTVSNSTFNLKSLERELHAIAISVDGVEKAGFIEIKTHEASVYRQQKFELPSKVLFVDDEKDFVHAVSRRLISRDVGTYGVYDGEEALNIVLDDRPDVMVLDLKMPGLHGTEVLERVKKLEPLVEVIILTGHGNIKDEQVCMELGAYAYLNKPVDIEKLSETIKAANVKVHQSRAPEKAKTS